MKHQFFVTLSILVFINVQAEQITFEQNKESLKKCIETYLSKDTDVEIANRAEGIAEIASTRFFSMSYSEEQFKQATNGLYYTIKHKKYHIFTDNIVPEKLRLTLRCALENCIERKNLPRFANEPAVLGDLLDFVLVDWPNPPSYMISTQDGRSTLRRYAYSAGMRLLSALRYFFMNYHVFHHELRRIWILRAQQFYDGRGAGIPYIRHRFTTNTDRIYSSIPLEDVHMIDNTDVLIRRTLQDFPYRNPIVGPNLAATSRRRYYIYPFGETSADDYLETHMNQCYGIIFFMLELQLRGIDTDRDDCYAGLIPSSLVPFSVSDVVRNNEGFINYLFKLRENFEEFSPVEVKQCFSSGTIEELIVLLAASIVTNTTTLTTTTSTTTIMTTSSESSGYEDRFKKNGTREWDCENYFSSNKRFRSMYPEQEQQLRGFDTNFKGYGYIVNKKMEPGNGIVKIISHSTRDLDQCTLSKNSNLEDLILILRVMDIL